MPQVIHMVMVSIWEVILWNEPENLWSLSRPLLPLILIDQTFFQQYVECLCSSQPLEKQKMISDASFFLKSNAMTELRDADAGSRMFSREQESRSVYTKSSKLSEGIVNGKHYFVVNSCCEFMLC